jgi:hypothetical protein
LKSSYANLPSLTSLGDAEKSLVLRNFTPEKYENLPLDGGAQVCSAAAYKNCIEAVNLSS